MNRRAIETWPPEPAGRRRAEDAPVLFDAVIRPNRSLPPPGFYVVMGVLMAVSFTAGVAFALRGAWPVLGYFGLDVALVWLCFHLSYRDGRRMETVQVTPGEIRVARRWPAGREIHYTMPAAWARVEVAGAGEADVQTRLAAMGKRLIVGAMLSPRERESFADALRDVLEKARRARGPAGAAAQESGGAP